MKWLQGKKTYIGAIATMLGGAGMLLRALVAEPFEVNAVITAITVIAGAFAVLGIGAKIERKLS